MLNAQLFDVKSGFCCGSFDFFAVAYKYRYDDPMTSGLYGAAKCVAAAGPYDSIRNGPQPGCFGDQGAHQGMLFGEDFGERVALSSAQWCHG
ncbi:hypothetical protein [Asaia platycodi]|uniref:hypothetical protein n=1 Tax=Asaia platycodi TaxID=610243 RepID=UPI001F5806CC|nr:hypothetical protein [Asaia platycodi]